MTQSPHVYRVLQISSRIGSWLSQGRLQNNLEGCPSFSTWDTLTLGQHLWSQRESKGCPVPLDPTGPGHTAGLGTGFRVRQQHSKPAQPLTGCVMLGTLLSLSEPISSLVSSAASRSDGGLL